MKRRPKGEGSYSKRSDGLWRCMIDAGRNDAGRRQRRYVYAKTLAALRRKIADETLRSGGSLGPVAKGTVAEWIDHWLEHTIKPNGAAATYESYAIAWGHAKPIIGAMRLQAFDVQHVERLYAHLRSAVTPAVHHRIRVMLSSAFSTALRQQRVRVNPFALVPLPAYEAPGRKATLSQAEAKRFCAAARADRYEALWMLCITGGLRLGECLGLRWSEMCDQTRLGFGVTSLAST